MAPEKAHPGVLGHLGQALGKAVGVPGFVGRGEISPHQPGLGVGQGRLNGHAFGGAHRAPVQAELAHGFPGLQGGGVFLRIGIDVENALGEAVVIYRHFLAQGLEAGTAVEGQIDHPAHGKSNL